MFFALFSCFKVHVGLFDVGFLFLFLSFLFVCLFFNYCINVNKFMKC